MGFFDDLIKEITRPFEQLGSEIGRVYGRFESELKRFATDLTMSFAAAPLIGGMQSNIGEGPSARIVEGSSPIKITEGETIRRPKKGTGKSFRETILTGDLVPTSTGKKTLLG